MSFEGKTAWITGASSGIGAALAREWASRGANIILSGRDEARLADVAGTLPNESLVLPFDVRDDMAMQGNTVMCGNAMAICRVSLIMPPQSGSGGGSPRPRKPSTPMVMIT